MSRDRGRGAPSDAGMDQGWAISPPDAAGHRVHTPNRFRLVTQTYEAARRCDADIRGGHRQLRLMLAVTDGVLFRVEEANLHHSDDGLTVVDEPPLPATVRLAVARALESIAAHLEDRLDRERVTVLRAEATNLSMTGVQALELLFSMQAILLEVLGAGRADARLRESCSCRGQAPASCADEAGPTLPGTEIPPTSRAVPHTSTASAVA
jgi:hypothetical protein